MNAEQLRDYLAEHIEWKFPNTPVWLAIEGRVYEIGRILASGSGTHIILEAGEEEELSKQWNEQ
jgi:predicted heme/steroid binding protein